MSTVGPRSFGLGPVALNLVREQRALGLDAKIWCLDEPADIEWARKSADFPPGAIVGHRTAGPRFLGYSPALERALLGPGGEEVQLLHQHGIWTAVSRAANAWRRRSGGPTVIAPHGSLEAWAVRRSAWKKRLALLGYEAENMRDAACFHATAQPEAEGFRAYGIRNPIALIPNGLSESWIESRGDARRFRNAYGVPAESRILLYMGRVTPVKNLEMVIGALAARRSLLDGWILLIAGSDEFGYKAILDAVIAEHDLARSVKFIGFVPAEHKRDAFAAASVFVLPSRREASPITVLEALGAGVPVLTTRGTPWAELETHQCGWWCEVSEAAIGRALEEAMTTTESDLAKFGEGGRNLVRSRYTWDAAAARCRDLYEWLLGVRPRPDTVLPSDSLPT